MTTVLTMESKSKESAKAGETIIITVEEMERRKDRFRKATRDYYEQAEKGYRVLHGFCSRGNATFSNTKLHEIQDENEPPSTSRKRKRCSDALPVPSLKRCRQGPKRNIKVPELQADLALRLLESHYSIVELAMNEYLFAIRHLIRPSPSLLPRLEPTPEGHYYQQGPRSSISVMESDGVLLRLPSVMLPLPLPIAFDTSDESVERRLKRHRLEVVEEEHMAMASFMSALRESKITKDLAKKIYEGTQSIQMSLNKVSLLIEANRHNTFFCFHYDCFRSDSEATIFKPSTLLKGSGESEQQTWDQEVVDARVLDGYFRWFRDNNGVLLNHNGKKHNKNQNTSSSGGDQNQTCEAFHRDKNTVGRSTKRPRKVSVDEEQRHQMRH